VAAIKPSPFPKSIRWLWIEAAPVDESTLGEAREMALRGCAGADDVADYGGSLNEPHLKVGFHFELVRPAAGTRQSSPADRSAGGAP
jgi:hypothetical protein